jgi:hypothetical protein
MGIPRICEDLKEWGYKVDLLRLPHDGGQHEQTTGRTKREMYEDIMGCGSEQSPKPKGPDEKAEQMNAVRAVLPVTQFDALGCEDGIFALESYRREWDDKNMVFRERALHDWSSTAADSFRTGAVKTVPGEAGRTAPGSRGARRPRVIRSGGRKKSGRLPERIDIV